MGNTMETMAESLLHSLVTTKFPYLTLGETATDVLQRFVNVDVTTSSLADALKRNQLYRAGVESYVEQRLGSRAHQNDESGSTGSTESSLTYCIQLLGMLGTRNLISSLRQVRSFGQEWPFKGAPKAAEGDKPAPKPKAGTAEKKFQPDEYLKFALKAQEFCQSYQVDYAEGSGFASGLVFDYLRMLITMTGKKNPAVAKYFEESWRDAVKTAFLTSRLASRVKGFGYAKYGFAAGLMLTAGKLLICIDRARESGSEWLEFEKSAEKIPELGRREVRHLQERERFGFTHQEIAAMALQYFTVLKPIAPAVGWCHTPFYLKNIHHDLYTLSSCLAASTILADYGKPVEAGKEPLRSLAENKWFKDLKLRDKDMIEVTKEASGVTA